MDIENFKEKEKEQKELEPQDIKYNQKFSQLKRYESTNITNNNNKVVNLKSQNVAHG